MFQLFFKNSLGLSETHHIMQCSKSFYLSQNAIKVTKVSENYNYYYDYNVLMSN